MDYQQGSGSYKFDKATLDSTEQNIYFSSYPSVNPFELQIWRTDVATFASYDWSRSALSSDVNFFLISRSLIDSNNAVFTENINAVGYGTFGYLSIDESKIWFSELMLLPNYPTFIVSFYSDLFLCVL